MHVLSSFQRTGFSDAPHPLSCRLGNLAILLTLGFFCQPLSEVFFRIFFQRRAAVPGGLCADWVGLANPRFPGSKCVVGKTNIRIRLKGVNPHSESRVDLSKERFRIYARAKRGASSAETGGDARRETHERVSIQGTQQEDRSSGEKRVGARASRVLGCSERRIQTAT